MINSIFPVQYFKTKYTGDVEAVKTHIKNMLEDEYDSLATTSSSLYTGPSVTTFVRGKSLQDDAGLTDLTCWIKSQCQEFADALEYAPGHYQNKIMMMWANYSKKGSHIIPHRHSPAFIAFVYYANKQPGQGNFYFTNPLTPILEYQPYKTFRHREREYVENQQLPPLPSLVNEIETETGDLIIFPAYLDHSAYPNNLDDPRIVIAGQLI
jgi:hypothetical protein